MSILDHFRHAIDGTKEQLENALTNFSLKSEKYSSHRFMDELKWGPTFLLSPRRKDASGAAASFRVNLQNSIIYLSFIPIKPGASCYSDFEQPRFVVADLRNLTGIEKEAYFKDKFNADLMKVISAGPAQEQNRGIDMLEKSRTKKILDKFGLAAGLGACAWCAVQTGVGVQQTAQLLESAAPIIHPNVPAPVAK